MIKFKTTVKGMDFISTVYNQWDIEESEIVEWNSLTIEDKGKYVMFDDGSELYAKIIHVGNGTIQTECGTYVIGDIVHCFQPKYKKSNYAGVFASELNLKVLPLARQEKSIVTRIINGEKMNSLTPRIEEGVANATVQQMIELGYDPKEVSMKSIDRIIRMAMSDKDSPQVLKANENLQRMINNIDITKLETQASLKKKDLGAIENATFTIGDNDSEAANNLLTKIRG